MEQSFAKKVLMAVFVSFLLLGSCEYLALNTDSPQKIREKFIPGVTDLRFSRDGSKIITFVCTELDTYPALIGPLPVTSEACARSRMKVLDARTLGVVDETPEIDGTVNSLASSPDGRYFVAAGTGRMDLECNFTTFPPFFYCEPVYRGGKLTILDAVTGQTDTMLLSSSVQAAAFSNDGEYLVTVLRSGFVEVWDFDARQIVHQIDVGYSYSKAKAQFTPDDRYLILAFWKLYIIDTQTWTMSDTLPGKADDFAIDPVNNRLFVSSGNTLKAYELGTWRELSELRHEYKRSVGRITVSSDGLFLARIEFGVPIERIGTWDGLGVIPEEDVNAIEFSPVRTRLGCVSRKDSRISIWEW